MTTWDHFHPGAGDTAAVRDFAAEQQRRADDLETTINGVVAVQSDVTGSNVAGAIEAWSGRVDDVEADFRTAIGWLEARKTAADSYADTVDDIATRAQAVASSIRSLLSSKDYLKRQDDIPQASLNSSLWKIDERLTAKRAELSALGEEREAADTLFTSTLNLRADIRGVATWATLTGLYGEGALSGTFSVFLARRREVLDEATRLLSDLADGGLDDDDLARLEEIMRGLAQDNGGSTQLWQEIDGEQTREMLWGLSFDMPTEEHETSPSLEVARLIRDSLSIGSADWDQRYAEKFVEELTTGPHFNKDTLPGEEVIAFLFADVEGSPMGVTFATAMATRFDEYVRNPNKLEYGTEYPSLRDQAYYTRQRHKDYVRGADQPMGLVLETLSAHSEQSLGWFTDTSPDTFAAGSTAGQERINYWFGEHDWHREGMTGVTAALESALYSEGGIAGGSAGMDREVWVQQANLVEGIFDSLGDATGATFTPDGLSPNAQQSMANSLNTSLAWIVESALVGDLLPGQDRTQFLSTGDDFPAPVINASDAAKIWGTVAGTSDGLRLLTDGVNQYQATVMEMAEHGEHTGVQWSAAFDRVASLEGFHQGAAGGVNQYLAKLSDDNVNAFLDGAGTVTGVLSVPGAEKLPHAVQALFNSEATRDLAIEVTKTATIEVVSDAAAMRWGDSLSTAITETNSDLLSGYNAFSDRLDDIVGDSPPGLEAQLGTQSVDDFKGRLRDRFTDEYVSALSYVNQPGLKEEFELARGNGTGIKMRKFRPAALALSLLVALVAGCSADEPSVLESPDVIWPESNPTSEYDDSPYVQALRAGLYEMAIAWNNLDFTDQDLINTWSYPEATRWAKWGHNLFAKYYYRFDINEGADPSVYLWPGPETLIITGVWEEGHGSALVDTCSLPPSTPFHSQYEGRFHVTLNDDGTSVIKGSTLDPDEVAQIAAICEQHDLKPGLFDPAPTPVTSPHPDAVRYPLPKEAYGLAPDGRQ